MTDISEKGRSSLIFSDDGQDVVAPFFVHLRHAIHARLQKLVGYVKSPISCIDRNGIYQIRSLLPL